MIGRKPMAALVVTASLMVGVALEEGFLGTAKIPVKGDVMTIGHGTTRNPDGTPIRANQTITPQRAMVLLLDDLNSHSNGIKKCIDPAPLHQHEFDAYSSLAYNVGVGAFCSSSIPKKLKAGGYEAACKTILDFNGMCVKRVKVRVHGKLVTKCVEKKVLRGLDNRRKREYAVCTGGGND